jgi:hypothetical protein
VQGQATILQQPHETEIEYPGAQFLVAVEAESIWVNCPRYIHAYEKRADSRYLPNAEGTSPLPGWKRLDVAQDAIRPQDRAQVAAAGGVIDQAAYAELLQRGEG